MSYQSMCHHYRHSNRAPDELIDHLRQQQVTVLVDVRSVPFSRRFPHFSRDSLRALLREHHIRYSYAGEKLGGRPQDEAVYRGGEIPDNETHAEAYLKQVNYDAVMQQAWYREGIARLLEIVSETQRQGHSVAVLCSEGDPRQCHRHHLIAKSLLTGNLSLRASNQPVRVQHILRDGTLEPPLDSRKEFQQQTEQPRLL